MWKFLRQRWFLVSLLLLIPLGMLIGYRADPQRVSTFPKEVIEWASGGLTALVLFLMSVTLATGRLVHSLRSPGPVVWAAAINYGLIPLMAVPLLSLQRTEDFVAGLMIAACVPSTMAAASVWTRKAGGNDAVSLLVTIVTNGGCFLLTPLWLKFGLGDAVALDTVSLMTKLFFTALVPISLGQFMRAFAGMRRFADRGKAGFSALAQGCILAIIFWAAIQGGVKLNASQPGSGTLTAAGVTIVWLSCIVLHLAGAAVAWSGHRLLGFSKQDVAAGIFAASQKTLPIGILVAAGMTSTGRPFAAIPILMYHASQLVLDTLFIEPLRRWIGLGSDSPPGELEAARV